MLDPSEIESRLLEELNVPQREAVTLEPRNCLVLAGAGSGKTKVLTHRFAYLVEHYGFSIGEILAVTFTNKAAREMRRRVEQLLGHTGRSLWVGTFHGTAHRILRTHWERANLKPNFEILAADDQRKVVKNLMDAEKAPRSDLTANRVCNQINRWKDEGKRPHHVLDALSADYRRMLFLYEIYEEYCEKTGLVDFAELLLRCLELWLEHEDILKNYQMRFRYLLVDEFQDTNSIQFNWVRRLAGTTGKAMVVGDDDQSIYGWRGALVGNMKDFTESFKDVQTIRLEQNYRSTGHILKGANGLITHNQDRLGKDLWTQSGEGKPITIYETSTEFTEANYVYDVISKWMKEDSQRTYNDIAVLYRNNYQSRLPESALTQRDVPYKVRGGTRFYDRQEIRITLAYMRMTVDKASDFAFTRVLTAMPRGIGEKSQAILQTYATAEGKSLWDAMDQGLAEDKRSPFTARQKQQFQGFKNEIDRICVLCKGAKLKEVAEVCSKKSGYVYYLQERFDERTLDRQENLEELVRACSEAQGDQDRDGGMTPEESVMSFLNSVSLDPADEQDPVEPSVSLLTVHSAKGLEFPLVVLIGMEEGIFPHWASVRSGEVSEERRLAYVGVTRAMQEVHLVYARERTDARSTSEGWPSRFITEIPEEHKRQENDLTYGFSDSESSWRSAGGVSSPPRNPSPFSSSQFKYKIGDRIVHDKFGTGIVTDVQGTSTSERVRILFDDGEHRRIMASIPVLHKTS